MNDIIVNIPPAAPPQPKRFWGGWATAGFGAIVLIGFFLLLVFVMVIVLVVLVIMRQTPLTNDGLMSVFNSYMGLLVSVSGIVAYAGGAALLVATIKVRGGAGIAEYLALKQPGWKTPLVVVGITAAYLFLGGVVSGYFHVGEGDTKTLVDIYNTSVWPALLWIAVVVLAPIFEEALFRGFLFEGFRRSRIGIIGAILITSAAWTVLHAGYSSYSLGAIFIFGLVLGLVRYRTGSLWNTMLMHAFYNAVGVAAIAFNIGV